MASTQTGLWALMAGSFILAATHSINPDHWFPFIMVGRAKKWKTTWVLGLACLAGIGHVGTSVIIGLVGVFAKKGLAKDIAVLLENATPLLLILFGFSYAAYAFYKLRMGAHGHAHGIPLLNRWMGLDPHLYEQDRYEHPHNPMHDHVHDHDHHHPHDSDHGHTHTGGFTIGKINLQLHNMDLHIGILHDDHIHDYDTSIEENHNHRHVHEGTVHHHEHVHRMGAGAGNHAHVANQSSNLQSKNAGWGLVAILGLTPCIALLPLTFAAVKYGTTAIILVNITFALATIGTILVFTWLGYLGLSWIKLEFFDRYGDVIAGIIIGLIGVATKLFGL
jgi:hypothetical protein